MTIQVRETEKKGRGVFALVPFTAGQKIEEAPVFVLPAEQKNFVDRTSLADLPYDWSDGAEALVMGYGSFYNHSYRPNARYVKNFARLTMGFISLRPIAAGEEITVNYNGLPDDLSSLWFAAVPES